MTNDIKTVLEDVSIKPCPICGGTASTGWSARGFLNMAGWTTDCDHCLKAPRVTRFTRDESIASWNRLVSTALQASQSPQDQVKS